jgi:hypothetical protein
MSEETTAPESSDTAVVDAPSTPAVDEVAAATPDNAGSRNPTPNKYKQEIENLLEAYETKQGRIARERAAEEAKKPPPEPEGLLEGESWDSIYSSQPAEVQRAMGEMRKAFTRKTQELSAERRKLQAQNKAFMDSGLMDSLTADAGKTPTDFDPFNPEHIQQLIDAKVAARLKSVLEPMHKRNQQHEAAARYTSFKEQHPDLIENAEVKKGVYAALQADPNLKLQDAYWSVRGKMLASAEQVQTDRADIRRRAAQRAALITDKGRRPGRQVLAPDLKDKSAYEIYTTLKSQRG